MSLCGSAFYTKGSVSLPLLMEVFIVRFAAVTGALQYSIKVKLKLEVNYNLASNRSFTVKYCCELSKHYHEDNKKTCFSKHNQVVIIQYTTKCYFFLCLIKRIFANFRLNQMDFHKHICSTEDICTLNIIFNLVHSKLLNVTNP